MRYERLADFGPQQSHNWVRSELLSFEQLDGRILQGVLFKPENFDPGKKYPIIFNYYQVMSHQVYDFPQPEFVKSGAINIPWFVSRGYLVFLSDIHYTIGQTGASICEFNIRGSKAFV